MSGIQVGTRSERELRLRYLQARAELERRRYDPVEALIASCFPAQRRFVLSPAKSLIGQCTRRAGKTHGSAAKLILTALRTPRATCLYLALTRKSAKRLLWPKLRQLLADFRIEHHCREADLEVEFPNGASIVLQGADQENFVERLRGDAYAIVVIDEAASFGEHLEYTITDVLEPATLDFDGSIAMIGSPGPVLHGPFYDACTDAARGWEVHKWSVRDNPNLPHASRWLDELKRKRNWTDDNPTWLREYCNHWTEDPDSLIYRYAPGRNDFQDLPAGHEWMHILGIDLGFDDPASWSVIAFSEYCPNAYIIHNEAHSGWAPEDWAKLTMELQARYRPIETVADAGALGKAIVFEMQTRYGIPVNPAEKSEKMAMIELMNGDFQTGRLLVHESLTELRHQYRVLTKDKTGKREDPRLPNDRCDSVLYPYRHARHFWHKERDDAEPGSEAYWQKVESEQIEKLAAHYASSEQDWLQ